MKWFKHDSDARNDVKIKLLKAKFGAEGYGVYFQLLEVIAENVKEGNYTEWGQVESIHNIDTLAIECGVSPAKLRNILDYCNEINLLHKIEHKLTAPNILDRLADYAQRKAREADKFDVSQRKQDLVRIISGQSSDIDTPKNRREQKRTEKKESVRENKSNGIKNPYLTDYHEWLEAFNEKYKTKYKSQSLYPNYAYWRNDYSKDELLQIIPKIRKHDWLKDKIKPELVLRQKDTHGNPVNRIGELLSIPEEQYL